MYEIVVGLDTNEERAVAQSEAIRAIRQADAQVTADLFHSFVDNPAGASIHQMASVRRAKERLEAADVSVSLHETSGDPAEEIIRFSDDRDVDLICLAGRKRTPAKKAILGSVTQKVVLNTDRPVMICGEHQLSQPEQTDSFSVD